MKYGPHVYKAVAWTWGVRTLWDAIIAFILHLTLRWITLEVTVPVFSWWVIFISIISAKLLWWRLSDDWVYEE